ncbi:MAG: 23S rRNA (guanosine(2251)-2'-O)-methyltransferase RlmB [Kiritimatiellae bacterium]|nr:23S rRNA (guanosine(2251)-2'-O)-methyltransferase RlmB [Kiritimatiellia bacterium]
MRREQKKVGNSGEWLYGRRPVLESLIAGRRHFYEALLPEEGRDSPELAEIRHRIQSAGIPFRTGDRNRLDALCEGGNHQGVALRVGGYPYFSFDDLLAEAERNPQAAFLLLDHIEDPQNVGSLLRSADAAGVTAVILPEDRAAGVTAAAVRASAGAAEHLRVAKVVNLTRAMEALKERQVWLTGLDMDTRAKPYTEIDFTGRVGLVVGSEGRGLSRLVHETCDFIAYLPMLGKVGSLNAGVAGGIALYEIVRQRRQF